MCKFFPNFAFFMTHAYQLRFVNMGRFFYSRGGAGGYLHYRRKKRSKLKLMQNRTKNVMGFWEKRDFEYGRGLWCTPFQKGGNSLSIFDFSFQQKLSVHKSIRKSTIVENITFHHDTLKPASTQNFPFDCKLKLIYCFKRSI